jgi:protein-S-isoprenylcysteine O-methyltransferase Ste14
MRRAALAVLVALLAGGAVLFIGAASERQTLAAGLALAAVGLPMLIVSRVHLGRAFSVMPRATTLVTKGVYSKIPHPMFAFLDLALLGVVIALRRQWLIVIWLGLVLAHAWAAKREAKVLEGAFGDAYRNYRARTWW